MDWREGSAWRHPAHPQVRELPDRAGHRGGCRWSSSQRPLRGSSRMSWRNRVSRGQQHAAPPGHDAERTPLLGRKGCGGRSRWPMPKPSGSNARRSGRVLDRRPHRTDHHPQRGLGTGGEFMGVSKLLEHLRPEAGNAASSPGGGRPPGVGRDPGPRYRQVPVRGLRPVGRRIWFWAAVHGAGGCGRAAQDQCSGRRTTMSTAPTALFTSSCRGRRITTCTSRRVPA